LGEARNEYEVERDPVKGVSVSVKVYGKVDMGALGLGINDDDCGLEAAGKVLNLRPVDMPISDDTGE
jgi:hypothetical protein